MACCEIALDMDLEEFRVERGLSYDGLAQLIGCTQNRQAQAYATGETWPKTEKLETILKKTGGVVTIHAMHKRRLKWLRANGRLAGSHKLGVSIVKPSHGTRARASH